MSLISHDIQIRTFVPLTAEPCTRIDGSGNDSAVEDPETYQLKPVLEVRSRDSNTLLTAKALTGSMIYAIITNNNYD